MSSRCADTSSFAGVPAELYPATPSTAPTTLGDRMLCHIERKLAQSGNAFVNTLVQHCRQDPELGAAFSAAATGIQEGIDKAAPSSGRVTKATVHKLLQSTHVQRFTPAPLLQFLTFLQRMYREDAEVSRRANTSMLALQSLPTSTAAGRPSLTAALATLQLLPPGMWATYTHVYNILTMGRISLLVPRVGGGRARTAPSNTAAGSDAAATADPDPQADPDLNDLPEHEEPEYAVILDETTDTADANTVTPEPSPASHVQEDTDAAQQINRESLHVHGLKGNNGKWRKSLHLEGTRISIGA